ncbi:hypothetical protein [Plantactinospora sp. KLBMP9567]|uniref:hypothetical protein n=1 Tax=Plantactinospora sp. KLBMP9567 TaxID=3085900 RepID=UPI002981959D|nr:hypothetical protein [Plantactinospora sp. KLBMP9567]MDW5328672.1 hypothetical protein [Plantactinospora sp. KLBMP9567]
MILVSATLLGSGLAGWTTRSCWTAYAPTPSPESFKLTLRDRDAFDRTVAGPLLTELREMPGVDNVVYSKG